MDVVSKKKLKPLSSYPQSADHPPPATGRLENQLRALSFSLSPGVKICVIYDVAFLF